MKTRNKIIRTLIYIIIFIFLYMISIRNYLLFHNMVETFSICISATIFVIYVNSKNYITNNYLAILGIAYLFIGGLDFLHTMGYKGMNIFTDYDYYANQLWIATRFLESLTLLFAFSSINLGKRISDKVIFSTYLLITTSIILSVFYFKNFPICFIEGKGQTDFKIISEYIISTILVATLIITKSNKKQLDVVIYKYILLSIIFTIFSEMSFAIYISNYGFSNIVGHLFKIISFYFIYKSIVEKSINEPYQIIFKELNDKKNELDIQIAELNRLSIRDDLTGLYNRKFILDFIQTEISRYTRYNEEFIIAMLDIDNFKIINDIHGHIIGDAILKEIGVIMRNNIRDTDVVGRYGGEEFIVLMTATNIENGFIAIDKLRGLIENELFSNNLKVTISGGLASYTGLELEDTIDLADKKMYEAKRLGRNKILY